MSKTNNEQLPMLLKLWSDMTHCQFDANNNARYQQQSSTMNDNSNNNNNNPSCRGLFRRVNEILQDTYVIYKASEKNKQSD
jgi:hypothetical protein